MSTDHITIITTYYNEPTLLFKFIDEYKQLKQEADYYKLIIVDDGSMVYPIMSYLEQLSNVQDVSVYKVIKDLGFNSHGARNLGLLQSTTEFNFFADIDCILTSCKLESIYPNDLHINSIYSFTVNSFLTSKKVFMSCKGYDEEYVGIHYGDRNLMSYLRNNFNYVPLRKRYRARRGARNILFENGVEKTTYDDEKMIIHHPKLPKNFYDTVYFVNQRYTNKTFENKKMANFEWIQLL